jgi:ABC-2 type transport system permease protein
MSTATTEAPTSNYTPAAESLHAVLAAGEQPNPPGALSASVTFGWRAMLKIKHVPEQLFDVTMFPIMMTLMFNYLFGGALGASTGGDYLQYLLPGILVMSVVMITMYTGVGVMSDIQKGVFDRIRPHWSARFSATCSATRWPRPRSWRWG